MVGSPSQVCRVKAGVLAASCLFCLQTFARAEDVFSERTPGRILAEDEKTGADVEWRNSLVLKINSSELPAFTRYTPVLISAPRLFGQWELSQRFKAHAEVYGAGAYLEENEDGNGPSTTASTWFGGYGGRANVSLLTSNEISVFGGAEVRGESSRTLDRNNAGIKSSTTTEGHVLWRPYFGLIKKASAWHAGAWYAAGDENERTVTTEVLGDKRTEKELVTLAPRFGGFFDSSVGGQITVGTEIDFIMGSSASLKSGDKDVSDDSYRAQVHALLQLGGSSALWLALAHETLSYADQDFVTFENIPQTDFEACLLFGSGIYLGAILTYGQDKQSTDEINRSFELYGFSLRTGYKVPMK